MTNTEIIKGSVPEPFHNFITLKCGLVPKKECCSFRLLRNLFFPKKASVLFRTHLKIPWSLKKDVKPVIDLVCSKMPDESKTNYIAIDSWLYNVLWRIFHAGSSQNDVKSRCNK